VSTRVEARPLDRLEPSIGPTDPIGIAVCSIWAMLLECLA